MNRRIGTARMLDDFFRTYLKEEQLYTTDFKLIHFQKQERLWKTKWKFSLVKLLYFIFTL